MCEGPCRIPGHDLHESGCTISPTVLVPNLETRRCPGFDGRAWTNMQPVRYLVDFNRVMWARKTRYRVRRLYHRWVGNDGDILVDDRPDARTALRRKRKVRSRIHTGLFTGIVEQKTRITSTRTRGSGGTTISPLLRIAADPIAGWRCLDRDVTLLSR